MRVAKGTLDIAELLKSFSFPIPGNRPVSFNVWEHVSLSFVAVKNSLHCFVMHCYIIM